MLICSVARDDINLTDRVKDDLRETGARFDCRQVKRHTVFEHIAWDDIGVGQGRWDLGAVVNNQDQTVQVWARGMDTIPDAMRDRVEKKLQVANGWIDQGSFTWQEDSNVIEYIWPPMAYEELPWGIKGAMEGVDDLLGKVTPMFRKAAGALGRITHSGSITQCHSKPFYHH